MWANHRLLLSCLKECGFQLSGGAAPIASIQAGSTTSTLILAKEFSAKGILATPFVPPSVPHNAGVLRCIVGAKLSGLALDGLLDAVRQVGGQENEKPSQPALEPVFA